MGIKTGKHSDLLFRQSERERERERERETAGSWNDGAIELVKELKNTDTRKKPFVSMPACLWPYKGE